MRFSYRWLADYVDLPDPSAEDDGAHVLATQLTDAGLAIEGFEDVPADGDAPADAVLDLEITTNRPDAMNHLGLAREIAVLRDTPLRPPPVGEPSAADDDTTEGQTAAGAAKLVVEDLARCPRYVALVIRGVTVGPSPDGLRRRLETIGVRSINNVVDVTNYVLWETGQPLHAFDLKRLEGAQVRVRPAAEGETLTTLDGVERTLDPSMLVIADAAQPIALAGIMGGADSEVTEATVDVLLESAHFDPATVRRGAKTLGMHTDASHRFERGTDPEACLWAARRAAAMLVDVAGGTLLTGTLEARVSLDPPPPIEIDLDALAAFAGIAIDTEEAVRILTGLGFAVERDAAAADGRRYRVTPPSWRQPDFVDPYPADVYEEVLRIIGLDAIPSTLPAIGDVDAPVAPRIALRRRIQDHLAACGLAEAINFAFLDRARDAAFPSPLGAQQPIALRNPLSERYAVLRRGLLANLVESAHYNLRRGADAVRLFEIGHAFGDDRDAPVPDALRESDLDGVAELETVALVLGGRAGTPWEGGRTFDVFDLKGIVESLAARCGVALVARPADADAVVAGYGTHGLRAGAAATLHRANRANDAPAVGVIGLLADAGAGARSQTGLDLAVAELRVAALLPETDARLGVTVPPRQPGITVDTTLNHPRDVAWTTIAAAIDDARVDDLRTARLKDRYTGKGVTAGTVNTTISFHFQSDARSLTQDEVNDRHQALARALTERFGA